MTILDPFILPPDVIIVPVAQLAPELRDQIGHQDGDCAVTRPRSRGPSNIVDARTAALLESFRSPATIVDAVIAFGTAEGVDPRELLDDAFSMLGGFVNEGVLVSADSELAQSITSTLVSGETIGRFQVVEAVHVIVDTEVYLGNAADGSAAALKIARVGFEERLYKAFAHEATILASLDGRVNPRLLQRGVHDGRPFLAMSWCAGVDIYEAAADARRLAEQDGPSVLLQLGERFVEAYAHLHSQGVIHGDVHPRNVLVDGNATVTIIDYGLAGRPPAPGAAPQCWRGGIDFFMEPEIASARLAGRPDPALSLHGEQYSMGALLYMLLTGAHTHAFSLEREEMLCQLVEQPPLPFARHGTSYLPAVERILARTLAKDPAERYGSSGDLLRALRTAAEHDRERGRHAMRARPGPGPGERLLEDVLARLALRGELLTGSLAPPTASVMNGGAGFAYALLRIAATRDDEGLLSLADLWSTQAVLAIGSHKAFWNEELEIVPKTCGDRSFYHHVAGVHGVHTLVARARCDELSQQLALKAFVAAAGLPAAHVDVAFGRAGLLLGCSLMLEASSPSLDLGSLRIFSGTHCATVCGTNWKLSPRCRSAGSFARSGPPTDGPATSSPSCAGVRHRRSRRRTKSGNASSSLPRSRAPLAEACAGHWRRRRSRRTLHSERAGAMARLATYTSGPLRIACWATSASPRWHSKPPGVPMRASRPAATCVAASPGAPTRCCAFTGALVKRNG